MRCRLVCFPPAGGSASAFAGWGDLLPQDVDVVAVQMRRSGAGSGTTDADVLSDHIRDLALMLDPLGDVPVVLFGHSWGAIVAFEVALAVHHTTSWSVEHLVVAASVAPHVPLAVPRLSDLSRAQLVETVAGLGGFPAGAGGPRFLDAMEAGLRADLRLARDYVPRPRRPLGCPITVFGGTADPLTPTRDLDAWSEHSSAGYRRVMFDGGHFFVATARRQVVATLTEMLPSAPDAVGRRP